MTDPEHPRRGRRHAGPHRSLLLGPGTAPVIRVGRRQFLTELGRGTMAVAVMGGVVGGTVSGCSGDDSPDDGVAGVGEAETAAPPVVPSMTATSVVDVAGTDRDAADGDDDADGTLRWAQVSLGFVSAYVLVRGNEAAVVDTGSSGNADEIGRILGALGVNFDDVRHVVLTHSHGDHVGSLNEVLTRSPSAVAYAGELDVENILTPRAITPVGDGDDVFGLQVIATPGHTPGSISLLDPGIGLLVAGDALTGNDDGTGLSGSNERFTADIGAADASVVKLAGFDVETVAMGHGRPVDGGAASILRSLADTLG